MTETRCSFIITKMKAFVGREKELERLEDLAKSRRACLVVLKGRRRIGKSRLAEEFGKNKIFLPFSGLAPVKGVSAQDQRDAFARGLAALFRLPPFTFTDWSDGFAHLSHHLTEKPTVILFDEISWMSAKDPTFTSKLKVWWDLVLQNHPSLILILCGSISTWIDKNIINSTAFFGRVSLYLELTELSIPQCKEFLKLQGFKGSDLDFFKILSVTGGIPWYLEQIQMHESADENMKRLCFEKNGLLVHEFDRIFNDLFSTRGEIYKKIITLLSQGMKDRVTLQKSLGYSLSGTLSHHLKALEICGFVSKHPDWSLKTGKAGKLTLYRLSDNYLRFYIHYIEPNLSKIEQGLFIEVPLSSLPGWEAMLGFQLENLLLKNRSLLYRSLGIHAQDVLIDNPYLQRASGRKKGCQIDYLVQMRSNTLFVCEVKMRRRELDLEVIDEMKAKIDALAIPKGFGVSSVLLHLGPVSDALLSSRYFYRIIDIADL
ncbi:MAG TPA: ATP-binding protein [Chlamydiales bacterium]|nr:ATP-binding protein [Chlamydiales bacterium]